MTRDPRKRTPMGGPFMREHRGSGPEKQQPKHNPCRPVGRNFYNYCIHNAIEIRENIRWYRWHRWHRWHHKS